MTTKTIKLYPSPRNVQPLTGPMAVDAFRSRLDQVASTAPPGGYVVVRTDDVTVWCDYEPTPLEVAQDTAAAAEAKIKAIRDHLAPHPGDQLPEWAAKILEG